MERLFQMHVVELDCKIQGREIRKKKISVLILLERQHTAL